MFQRRGMASTSHPISDFGITSNGTPGVGGRPDLNLRDNWFRAQRRFHRDGTLQLGKQEALNQAWAECAGPDQADLALVATAVLLTRNRHYRKLAELGSRNNGGDGITDNYLQD